MSSSEDNVHEPLLGLGEQALQEDLHKRKNKSALERFEEKFVEIACPPGIDIGVFVVLQLLLLCEGITMSSVYSYVSYMVVDLGAAADIDEAGTWAGAINSVYFLCQFVSSFVMGYIADRVGRKPAFLFGSTGVFISLICFGFSTNIWMALAFRGINGLLNGNAAVGKAACGEITNETNRVKAFTYVGLMFGIGNIVGSTLGGFLARPDIDTFGGFFKKFPYALPTIGVSPMVFATILAILFFFTEPPRDKFRKKTTPPAAAAAAKEPKEAKEAKDKQQQQHGVNGPSGITYEDEDEDDMEEAPHRSGCGEKFRYFCGKVYKYRYVILCIGQYFIISCAQIIANMMLSTWTVAHVASGGLDFSTTDVGLATSIGGIAMLIMFAFFCTPIINKLKITGTMKLMSVLLTLDFIGMPFANNIARIEKPMAISNRALVWIYYGFLIALWQCTVQVMINCTALSTNNSVPVERLSIANAASQATGCAARAMSPVTIGPLLAWSLKPERKFPYNYFFCFIICAVASVIFFILSFFIPYQLNAPYNSKDGFGPYLQKKAEMEAAAKRGLSSAADVEEGKLAGKTSAMKDPYEDDGFNYVNKEDDEI